MFRDLGIKDRIKSLDVMSLVFLIATLLLSWIRMNMIEITIASLSLLMLNKNMIRDIVEYKDRLYLLMSGMCMVCIF